MAEVKLGVPEKTVAYEEIETKFVNAVRWIESAIGRTALGRFPEYVKILQKVVAGKKNSQIADEVFPEFLPIIPDIFRMISIHEGFSSYTTIPWVSEKLWLLTGGAASSADEGTTGSKVLARNTAFEFIVGCILLRDGWTPMSVPNKSDGIFSKGGHLLRVEAKRVQSASQLNKIISRAEKKLKMRQVWSGSNEPFGLIAVDLTRLINNGRMYLEARSESVALHALRQVMEKACKVSNPRPFENPLLLGTMLYADVPVLLRPHKRFILVGQRSQDRLTHLSQLDFMINSSKTGFYAHIAEKLFRSIKGT